jgi:hypothetical protein
MPLRSRLLCRRGCRCRLPDALHRNYATFSASLDGQRHCRAVLVGTRRAGNREGVGTSRGAACAPTSVTNAGGVRNLIAHLIAARQPA